jgi:hypothetical protein
VPPLGERVALLEKAMNTLTTDHGRLERSLDTLKRGELVRHTRERDANDRRAHRDRLLFAGAGLILTLANIAVQIWG